MNSFYFTFSRSFFSWGGFWRVKLNNKHGT
jgi:hypothetical protein